MAGNSKKPRKRHVPKRELLDPIRAAILRAAKLTPKEKALMLDPVHECFDRLKFGGFTNSDFKHLADVFNVAEALTQPGIGLLPDHMDKFDAGHYALKALAIRRNETGKWVAKGEEMTALETAIEYHGIQLDFASAGELAKATKMVDNTLKGARSGSPSKNHFHTVLRTDMEAACS